MNFNNFTIKSQEIVQKAIDLTRSAGQQQIEPVHILKAMISESESILNFIFQKLGASLPAVVQAVDKEIASLPKVSGGDVFLSRESNDAMQKAIDFSLADPDRMQRIADEGYNLAKAGHTWAHRAKQLHELIEGK